MDKFCLVAIMLFAIQHDLVDDSIVDVINAIDRVRGIIPVSYTHLDVYKRQLHQYHLNETAHHCSFLTNH